MHHRLILPFSIAVATLLLCAPAQSPAAQVIPFEYRDGLIWVRVKASGSGQPLHFILDSGAGSSVLSLDAARRCGASLGAATTVQRVGAGVAACRVKDFHATLGGIPVSESPLAFDLSHTSAFCSRPIDGLIGQDFFRGRIVQIDFKEQSIRLLEKADPASCCSVLRLKLDHAALCVPISVNGSALKWTRVDTGCDEALHWVGGNGGGYALTSLELGGEHLANVKTAIHATEIFPREAGLLGNGILSNYLVTIDAVNGRLFLQKT